MRSLENAAAAILCCCCALLPVPSCHSLRTSQSLENVAAAVLCSCSVNCCALSLLSLRVAVCAVLMSTALRTSERLENAAAAVLCCSHVHGLENVRALRTSLLLFSLCAVLCAAVCAVLNSLLLFSNSLSKSLFQLKQKKSCCCALSVMCSSDVQSDGFRRLQSLSGVFGSHVTTVVTTECSSRLLTCVRSRKSTKKECRCRAVSCCALSLLLSVLLFSTLCCFSQPLFF